MAFREAARKASPALLEPIFKVEITAPEEYMGDVIADISARRGKIEGSDMVAGASVIKAKAPLSEMFGYATDLRSKTQGRGVYTMQFDHFERVPESILEKIMR
jgi:elongation factor G